jgi:hypothetical protein
MRPPSSRSRSGFAGRARILAAIALALTAFEARTQTITGPLHNEDETDFFWNVRIDAGKAGDAIDRYVDVMADAGVKVLLCNTNARRTNYRSAVWDAYWDGYDPDGPDDQPFFASTPKADIAAFRKGIGNMLAVHRQGIDYPARVAARCRARGMSPWISLRMNDCHYNDVPEHAFHGSFWRKNPQLRRKDCSGYFATCLDYAHVEVRDFFAALAGESLARWDIDGLELDFMREPYLFSAGKEAEGRQILTAWLREVRRRTTEAAALRGHPVRLGVRVPSRPEVAFAMGLDAIAWAKEGLIDLLVVTPRWATLEFDMPLEQWRELLGNARVTLAGGLEVLCRPSPDAPAAMVSPELAAGAAAAVLARGADAVYLFNYFQSANVGWTRPVYLRTLAAMASLDALKRMPRSVAITYRDIVAPGESYRAPLPATGNELSFRLAPGRAGDARGQCEIRVDVASPPDGARPVPLVFANDRPCAFRKETGAGGVRRLIWEAPPGAIGADGVCALKIASADKDPLTVRSVELSMGAPLTGGEETR